MKKDPEQHSSKDLIRTDTQNRRFIMEVALSSRLKVVMMRKNRPAHPLTSEIPLQGDGVDQDVHTHKDAP
jgi:hypothetical protein